MIQTAFAVQKKGSPIFQVIKCHVRFVHYWL